MLVLGIHITEIKKNLQKSPWSKVLKRTEDCRQWICTFLVQKEATKRQQIAFNTQSVHKNWPHLDLMILTCKLD